MTTKTTTVYRARNTAGLYMTGNSHAKRWDKVGQHFFSVGALEKELWKLFQSRSSSPTKVANLAQTITIVQQEMIVEEKDLSDMDGITKRMVEKAETIKRLQSKNQITWATINDLTEMFPTWDLDDRHHLVFMPNVSMYDDHYVKDIAKAMRTFSKPMGSFKRGNACVAFKDQKHAMLFKLAFGHYCEQIFIGPA